MIKERYAKKAYCLLEEEMKKYKNEKIALCFSAGIDSTLLLKMALKNKIKITGFCIGFLDSEDYFFANLLKEKYPIKLFNLENYFEKLYSNFWFFLKKRKLDIVKSNILSPLSVVLDLIKENDFNKVMFGSGAEELFLGYTKYYDEFEKKDLAKVSKEEFDFFISKKGDLNLIKEITHEKNLIPIFPFSNKNFSEYILSLPISFRMGPKNLKKKGIREIAKIAGVDEIILNRNKKAIQYSTKSQREILKKAKKTNKLLFKKAR